MKLIRKTYAEMPELKEIAFDAVKVVAWPEFMFHDDTAGRLWGHLQDDFAAYQFALLDADADNRIVAVGHTLPLHWTEPFDALPIRGWDAIFERAVADFLAGRTPNIMTAIEASIVPDYRGTGISRVILGAMRDDARARGFTALIAPVRPSQKVLYPLTPIERYVGWKQSGTDAPFDAWLRTHWRLGARIVKIADESMRIENSVAKWESWTGLRFPETGEYVIPGALCPIQIDLERDLGTYVEPNVWMHHEVTS
jgi:GNAT superfamily N-acetyltransferase